MIHFRMIDLFPRSTDTIQEFTSVPSSQDQTSVSRSNRSNSFIFLSSFLERISSQILTIFLQHPGELVRLTDHIGDGH
jgi:hypothetical protein